MEDQEVVEKKETLSDIIECRLEIVAEVAILKVERGEITEEQAFRLFRRYADHLRNSITLTAFNSDGNEQFRGHLPKGSWCRHWLLHRYLQGIKAERRADVNTLEKINKSTALAVDALYDQANVLNLFSKGMAEAQVAALAELGKGSICPADGDLEVVAVMAKATHYLLQSLALLGDNGQGPARKKECGGLNNDNK